LDKFAHFEITQVTQNFGDNAELFEELGIISGDARYTTKLGIHQCTYEDFEKFYPVGEQHFGTYTYYFPKFYCLDKPDDLFFFGTINSDVGSYLTLNLVECTGNGCMSPEERATFLDDKEPYFTTVFNN